MVKLPGGLFLFYSHGMFVCIEMRILKHEPYTPVVSEADGVEKEIEEIFSWSAVLLCFKNFKM